MSESTGNLCEAGLAKNSARLGWLIGIRTKCILRSVVEKVVHAGYSKPACATLKGIGIQGKQVSILASMACLVVLIGLPIITPDVKSLAHSVLPPDVGDSGMPRAIFANNNINRSIERQPQAVIEELEPRLLMSTTSLSELIALASPISVGMTDNVILSGSIDSTQGQVYSFTAGANSALTVDMLADGSGLDPQLSLYKVINGSARRVKTNSNADRSTLDSRLAYNLDVGTQYYIQTLGQKGTLGSYDLAINTQLIDEAGDEFANAALIALSGSGSKSIKGKLDHSADNDLYRFTATRTGVMILQQQVSRRGGSLEGDLVAYDAGGNQIISDASQDYGSNEIRFAVEAGQTYYIGISNSQGQTGQYKLKFKTDKPDEAGSSFASAGALALSRGGSKSLRGAMNLVGDIDFFQIIATRDGVMGISTLGLGKGPRTFALEAFDVNLQSLITDADTNDGLNEVRFEVTAGQVYYIKLTQPEDLIGKYVLKAKTYRGDEGGNDFANSVDLTLSSRGSKSYKGAIDIANDTDIYQITATKDGTWTVKQTSSTRRNAPEYSLSIYSSQQQSLAVNQGAYEDEANIAIGADAESYTLLAETQSSYAGETNEVDLEVEAGETYYVEVKGSDKNVGSYSLNVKTKSHPVNRAPRIQGIADMTISEDQRLDYAVDLWAFARDAETANADLIYSIVSATNTNIGVSILSNRYISLAPLANWSGYSDIKVKVSDGYKTNTDTFRVTVDPVNDAPILNSVSILNGTDENTAKTIGYDYLAAAVDMVDVDGDRISFRIESVTNGTLTKNGLAVKAGVTLFTTGESLVWTPPTDVSGTTGVCVISGWDGWARSSTTVQVSMEVYAVNQAPAISTISVLAGATEGQAYNLSYAALASASDASDRESGAISFLIDTVLSGTLTKDGQPVTAGATLLSAGESLVWTPQAGLGDTHEAFTVKAFDGELASAGSTLVRIQVAPGEVVDTAPVISGLPNITLLEGTTLNNETDIWAYAADAETADGDLVFTIVGNTNPDAGVTLDQNRWFDINPAAGFSGSTDITVQVSDGVNTATDTFTVTVQQAPEPAPEPDPEPAPEPVNEAPVISGLPNITLLEGTTLNNETDIWAFASDSETPVHELVFTIVGDTNSDAGVTLDQNRWFDINPAAGFSGSTEITVQVTDGVNTATNTFTVTVQQAPEPDPVPDPEPVNEAPVISGLPNITLVEGTTLNDQIDLWAYAADAETADSSLTFTIVGDTNSAAGVTLDQNHWIDVNPVADFVGSTDITVQVSDGVNTVTDTFTVTVTADGSGGGEEAPVDPVGSNNVLYIDIDGDGYGVAAPNGADADDSDASVNTVATMFAEYGSLENFLTQVKGYNVNRIFYIATDGNDATAEVGNPNQAYATWGAIHLNNANPLQPGDVVVWREGTYNERINTKRVGSRDYVIQGTADQPIVFMSFPGEQVVIDVIENAIEVGGTFGNGPNNIIFDGLSLDNTSAPNKGRGIKVEGKYQGEVRGVTFKNLLVENYFWGILANQFIHETTIEGSVIRNNGGEHGIYLASKDGNVNTNLTVRGNVIYGNAMQGVYHNGLVTNLLIDSNIIHSNGTVGIELVNGVHDSIIRNNLVFNNSKQAVVLYNYNSSASNILPFDQTNNLFVNNTFWVGQYGKTGGYKPNGYEAVLFNDAAGDNSFDNNIFRNNIIVTYAGPAFEYYQEDFLDTTVIENNIIHAMNGGAALRYGGTNYWGNDFENMSSLIRNNNFVDPQFVDVSVDYYNSPELFNFDLLDNSPAIDFGIVTDAPDVDLIGQARVDLPDVGCYEN